MKGILTKISDDVFGGFHPNQIYEGYTRDGEFKDKPTVGERFYIDNTYRYLNTSVVTSIIEDDGEIMIFKTENSTYKLEYENSTN